mgnify:CR=1 FL=1
MKKIILTAVLAAALAAAPTVLADELTATPTESSVYINDDEYTLDAYNINGNNYFKLRDLAAALSGTDSNFDVLWNEAENRIELTTGTDYTGEHSQTQNYRNPSAAQPTSSVLVIDGQTADIAAYNINDNNYYKLRDLGNVIPFDVYWVENKNAVCIYTLSDQTAVLSQSSGGSTRYMNKSVSTRRYQNPLRSYIYQNDPDSFVVVDVDGGDDTELVITADTYNGDTYELIGSARIEAELPIFGGFYAGEHYNYMVFGQENTEENDSKEVIRIVKYDKSFNRISSASVTGGESFTVTPFHAGSLRMSENGSELVIHTSRERYMTDDGLNHQSQLTIILNTDTMTVENYLGEFQSNHVSHSFNQFVLHDGDTRVLLDHGDAYPRAVVMNRSNGDDTYDTTILFSIPGETGDNTTGVSIGGFAAGENNYIAAINTIDHNAPQENTLSMMTNSNEERDLILLISAKENTDENSVKQIRLTDYIENNKCASLPYLVDLNNGRFMVIWEEYELVGYSMESNGVKYAVTDENGNISGEIASVPDARLSADCQPVINNGSVIWYINSIAGRMFYKLPSM